MEVEIKEVKKEIINNTTTNFDYEVYVDNQMVYYIKTQEESDKEWKYRYFTINNNKSEYPELYLPEIYVNTRIYDNEPIEIQTTSYGSMNSDEINKIIKGYQIAQTVVKAIDERFFAKKIWEEVGYSKTQWDFLQALLGQSNDTAYEYICNNTEKFTDSQKNELLKDLVCLLEDLTEPEYKDRFIKELIQHWNWCYEEHEDWVERIEKELDLS